MNEEQVRAIVRSEISALLSMVGVFADEAASDVLEDDSTHHRFDQWQGTKSLAYETISTISDIVLDTMSDKGK